MTTSEEQGELERASAEELIAKTAPFPGVERVRIELGEDHTGDPSMWIVFYLNADLRLDDSWFREFGEYSTKLGLKLIHSGLKRFPYTRIERAA